MPTYLYSKSKSFRVDVNKKKLISIVNDFLLKNDLTEGVFEDTFAKKTTSGSEIIVSFSIKFLELEETDTAVILIQRYNYSGYDYASFFSEFENSLTQSGRKVSYCNFTEMDFEEHSSILDNSEELPFVDVFDKAFDDLVLAKRKLANKEITQVEYKKIYEENIKKL